MLYFLKFWEIFLKSKSTKIRFINHFRWDLKQKWITNIKSKNSYLLVETDKDVSILQNTFWVYRIEAIKYNIPLTSNLKDFYKILDDIVKNYDFNTFVIRSKRENKQYFIDSMEIQRKLWKYVDDNYGKIPLYKNSDITIYIRILKDRIWIRTSKDVYDGIAWLPYGSEWKALNLFSWWIDSPVATFLAEKRGIRQDFLFLNIPWSKLLLSQVFNVYNFLKKTYSINWRFFTLNIQDIIQKIKEQVPSWYRQIVFKVFLYKIWEKACDELWVETIINGESIWQVSTQTLKNMQLLDSIADKLNIRPLSCFDKTEIMDIARKIWTLDKSSQIKETCSIENHSNAKINDKKYVLNLFEKLDIDFEELFSRTHIVKEVLDTELINKYKTDKIIWDLIDIEKQEKIPKLEEWKKYTFICSSWYKASSMAFNTRKKWYETYFLVK